MIVIEKKEKHNFFVFLFRFFGLFLVEGRYFRSLQKEITPTLFVKEGENRKVSFLYRIKYGINSDRNLFPVFVRFLDIQVKPEYDSFCYSELVSESFLCIGEFLERKHCFGTKVFVPYRKGKITPTLFVKEGENRKGVILANAGIYKMTFLLIMNSLAKTTPRLSNYESPQIYSDEQGNSRNI